MDTDTYTPKNLKKKKKERKKLSKEPKKKGKSLSGSLSSTSASTYSFYTGLVKPCPWTAFDTQNQVGEADWNAKN